jgi:hypothetical protein
MPSQNNCVVGETLTIRENLLTLFLSRQKFCFWGDDLDFHAHDWRLGCDCANRTKFHLQWLCCPKKLSRSAIVIRSPIRAICVSRCSEVSVFWIKYCKGWWMLVQISEEYGWCFRLMFLLSLISDILNCSGWTTNRNRQTNTWHLITMPEMVEFALKWHHECYKFLTSKYFAL